MNTRDRMRKKNSQQLHILENMLLAYPLMKKRLNKAQIMDDGLKATIITGMPRNTSKTTHIDREIERKWRDFEKYEQDKKWIRFFDTELAKLPEEELVFIQIVREEKYKNRDKREIGRPAWRLNTAFRFAEWKGDDEYPSPYSISEWWRNILFLLLIEAGKNDMF